MDELKFSTQNIQSLFLENSNINSYEYSYYV